MKYLTIMPDYTGSCIIDEIKGQIEVKELCLPQEFINELDLWHESYRRIIPLDMEQRSQRISEIDVLDKQGLKLSQTLSELIPNGAKVKYYSEGLLKYIPVERKVSR